MLFRSVSGTFGWGAELAANFASGIASKYQAVSSAASSLASAASGPLGHSIPKEGPLHNRGKGEKEWGEHAAMNFAEGIRNATGYVRSASSAAAQAAARGFEASTLNSPPAGYRFGAANGAVMSSDDMRKLAGLIGLAVAAEMPQAGPSIGSVEAVPGSKLDQAVENLFVEAKRKSRM